MKDFLTLLKYGFYNQLRNRWLIIYTVFYFGIAYSLMQFSADSHKGVLGLISIVILFNPAVSILYSTVYWYSIGNFNHLLLMQPISRSQVFFSNWITISLGLSLSFIIGTVMAFVFTTGITPSLIHLALVGVLLNFCFSALGLLCAVLFIDRMRGISASLGLWLYFTIIHDGLVFLLLITFRDYPMEKPAYFLMTLNPVDLARLYLLFQFEASALMGYTGSILQKMVGSGGGIVFLVFGLVVWILLPALMTNRFFRKSDL